MDCVTLIHLSVSSPFTHVKNSNKLGHQIHVAMNKLEGKEMVIQKQINEADKIRSVRFALVCVCVCGSMMLKSNYLILSSRYRSLKNNL